MHMNKYITMFFLVAIVLCCLFSCSPSETERDSKNAAVQFHVQFERHNSGQMNQIASMNIGVVNDQNRYIWGPQNYNFDDHGATLENVQAGNNYRVLVKAFRADSFFEGNGFSNPFDAPSGSEVDAGTVTVQLYGAMTDSGQALGNWSSWSVCLGDVDGDSDLDAFVGNIYDPSHIWLNNGNGQFINSGQTIGFNWEPAGEFGDLDGDGDLDLFLAHASGPNKVIFNDGIGFFYDSGQNLGNSDSSELALGDLDGDGDLDAFIANMGDFVGGGPGQPNTVWFNDGRGLFTDSGQQLASYHSSDVDLADLDGDGDLDAFVGNFGIYNGVGEPDKVWLNNGSGQFSDSGQNLGNDNTANIALGDIDGDGDVDMVPGAQNLNQLWINDGLGNFSAHANFMADFMAGNLDLKDIDDDGDLDVFICNFDEGGNTVFRNDGSGMFYPSGELLGNSDSLDAELGDLDGDGDLDAFVANGMGTNVNRVYFYQSP